MVLKKIIINIVLSIIVGLTQSAITGDYAPQSALATFLLLLATTFMS